MFKHKFSKEAIGLQTSQAEAATLSVLISVPFVYPATEKFFHVDPEKMPDLAREIKGLRRQLQHSCMGSGRSHKCDHEFEEKIDIPTNVEHFTI